MVWQFIGFGLTVGWMWIFFLGGPVFAALLKSWPSMPETHFQCFLLCIALSYLTVKKWSGNAPISTRKGLLAVGAACMAVGPGIIYLLVKYGLNLPGVLFLIYLLDVIGAWGCVVLMIAWQESFIILSFKKTCMVYAGGIGVASLSLFLGALFNTKLGIILTLMHPVASCFLLFKFQKSAIDATLGTAAHGSSPVKNSGRIYPVKLVLLIILFYTAGGLMYKLASLKYTLADLFWTSNISYMIVVALAGVIFYYIPNLDLRLLYRPVLPLLAAGFILFPFLSGFWVILSFLMLQAGFALFDMYTYLLIVYIARDYPRPTPILGLGMFWISFSIFTGNLSFSAVALLIPITRQPNSLVIVAGLITLLSSLVFQDNKETFVGWKTRVGEISVQAFPDPSPVKSPEPTCYLEHFGLTLRETEVLNMIRKGRNNPFICEKLNISPNTLKFHLRNIYQKFAVANRQELLSLFEDDEEDN